MNPALRRGALLCALALAATPASADRPAPRLRIESASFTLRDGSAIPVDRGTLSVPEDRHDPHSRRIDIGFVRFRSTSPHPGAPIVYLAGGPGGSGIATARGERQSIFLALRAVADVIALDQRGVGVSNHFPACTAEKPLDPALPLTEETLTSYHRAALLHCVARWRAAGVAVNGYTTEQNADDLDDLRRALGVRKIDLWGISYGTHLALAAMRRHPGGIGRVALASAEGMDQTVKLPAHVDAVFERIERAAGLPAGRLTGLMRRVLDRYRNPQPFTVTRSDGSELVIRVGAFPLRMYAGILPKNPDGIAPLLGAFAALEAGQTKPVAPLLYDYFYRAPLAVQGMPELMDVASGITMARLARVRAEATSALVGDATNFPMPQLRGAVPGLDLGDSYRREIRSAIPTLLLSGDLDVRTPLEEQAEATAGLTRLHRILVRNGGHDLFEAHPDIPAILTDFFSGKQVELRELTLKPPQLPARH
jgi:pimeloyl-ACP methyl ester carboxylesterase